MAGWAAGCRGWIRYCTNYDSTALPSSINTVRASFERREREREREREEGLSKRDNTRRRYNPSRAFHPLSPALLHYGVHCSVPTEEEEVTAMPKLKIKDVDTVRLQEAVGRERCNDNVPADAVSGQCKQFPIPFYIIIESTTTTTKADTTETSALCRLSTRLCRGVCLFCCFVVCFPQGREWPNSGPADDIVLHCRTTTHALARTFRLNCSPQRH